MIAVDRFGHLCVEKRIEGDCAVADYVSAVSSVGLGCGAGCDCAPVSNSAPLWIYHALGNDLDRCFVICDA